MPWEVLTASEEAKARKTQCSAKGHYPPTDVVYQALRWVCPACGAKSVVFPGKETPEQHRADV